MKRKFFLNIVFCFTTMVLFSQVPQLKATYQLKGDSLIFKFKFDNKTDQTIGFFPNAFFSFCDRKSSENCYCVKTQIGNKTYWLYPDASLIYPANEDTVWVKRREQFQFNYAISRSMDFFPIKSGVYFVVFIMPWIVNSIEEKVESNILEVIIPKSLKK